MKRPLAPALALGALVCATIATVPAAAASVPGAPAPCSAAPVDGGGYKLSWTRPADDGGAVIWRYALKVEGQRDPLIRLDAPTRKSESASRGYHWTHATAGGTKPLTFQIRAVNSAGVGTWCEAAPSATTVTPTSPNAAPTVDAGRDASAEVRKPLALDGTVADDGLPAGAQTRSTWSEVSGPGTVTFADPSATDTSATFSSAGTYVLRLTANDSALSASDDVVVTVVDDAPFLPYGSDSFFQSETTGAPIDSGLTASFRSFMQTHPDQSATPYPVIRGVGGNKWGVVYAEGKSSDPVWTIRNHNGSGKSQTSVLLSRGFRAPEWLGSMLTGTSDSPFMVVDRVNGFTVRGSKAAWVPGTHQIDILSNGATGVTYHSSNGLDARNPLSDDSRNFTSRGRISDGMVIKERVDHAIKTNSDLGHVLTLYFVETLSSAGSVHPMVGEESGKFGWGAEGVRIAIAPDVDLTKRGLSPAGLAIARTLQNYGAYLGDNAGGATSLNVEQETTAHPVWNGTLTASSLKGITWDDFVVIEPGWQ